MRCRICKQWIVRGWPKSIAPRAWRHGRTGRFTCDQAPIWWRGKTWPTVIPDESGKDAQAFPLE